MSSILSYKRSAEEENDTSTKNLSKPLLNTSSNYNKEKNFFIYMNVPGTNQMVLNQSFRYLQSAEGRHHSDCLRESSVFKACEPHRRVLSSSFLPNGGFGQYRINDDRAVLFERILDTPDVDRNFCVLVLEDQPVYFYADLDKYITGMASTEEIERMVTITLDFIETAFTKHYQQPFHRENFWYFEACTKQKLSFHIHADPDLPNVVFKDIMALSWFMKKCVQPAIHEAFLRGDSDAQIIAWKTTGGSISTFLDFNPYGKSQNVKLPLCCKQGKRNMILHRAPTQATDLSPVKQLSVGMIITQNYTQLLQGGETAVVPVVRQPRNHTGTTSTNNNASFQQMSVLLEVLSPCISGKARFYDLTLQDNVLRGSFAAQTATCPFTKRIHSSNRITLSGKPSTGLIIRCFSAGCKGKRHHLGLTTHQTTLLFEKPLLEEMLEELQIDEEQDMLLKESNEEQKQFDDQLKADFQLNLDKLGHNTDVLTMLLEHTHFILKSEKDTGKTELLKRLIEKELEKNPKVRILVLSCKRAYAVNMKSVRLKNLGFRCYLDEKDWKEKDQLGDRVIISLESLGRIQATAAFDIIVVDELESLCNVFYGETAKKDRRIIVRSLQYYLRSAKRVWGFDADTQRRGLEWLQSWSQKTFTFVHNIKKTDTRTYINHSNSGTLVGDMLDSIAMGKKVALVTTSKTKGEAFVDLIKTKLKKENDLLIKQGCTVKQETSLNFLHGKLDPEYKKRAMGCDIEQEWTKDILIITPVAPCGVDYSLKHFDELYIYGTSGSCSARDLIQLSWRIRKVSSNNVNVYVETKNTNTNWETSFKGIQHLFESHQQKLLANDFQEEIICAYGSSGPPPFLWQLADDHYVDLHTYNTQEDHRCRNDFKQEVKKIIERSVPPEQIKQFVSYRPALVDQEMAKELSEMEKQRKHAKIEAIVKAEPLSYQAEATLLQKRKRDGVLSDIEENQLKRTRIKRVYHTTAVDEKFVSKFGKEQMFSKLERFQAIQEGVTQRVREESKHLIDDYVCNSNQYLDQDVCTLRLLESFMGMSIQKQQGGRFLNTIEQPKRITLEQLGQNTNGIQLLRDHWKNIKYWFPHVTMKEVPTNGKELAGLLQAIVSNTYGFTIKKRYARDKKVLYQIDYSDWKKSGVFVSQHQEPVHGVGSVSWC